VEIRIFTGDYFMETTNSNYFGTEKIAICGDLGNYKV
jgi:hypothetical protein